jgi:toxin ParE1/3/4
MCNKNVILSAKCQLGLHPPGANYKFRLAQFPFSLLYIKQADCLWVVAVAHGSRKPGYWKQRVV